MATTRPFVLVRSQDQWSRASHQNTMIDDATGGVMLAWPRPAKPGGPIPMAGGMAFDGECRLYRSLPDEGRVERTRWRPAAALRFDLAEAQPVDLIEPESTPDVGDFAAVASSNQSLAEPRGLAVDVDDRLFLAETGAHRVVIYDLWSRRLVRRVVFADSGEPIRRPIDLAGHEHTVWVLTADPARLYRMEARSGPVEVPLPTSTGVPAGSTPIRVAVSPRGERVLLYRAPAGDCWVVPVAMGLDPLHVGPAGDFEFEGLEALVIAGAPGDPFRRFKRVPGGWTESRELQGRGYDGMGLVRLPDGSIGFWTGLGLRTAFLARTPYFPTGTVTTYRLDGGEYQTAWGRMFVDACIPDGTDVLVHWLTTDFATDEPTIARVPPDNSNVAVRRPDLSPPMPPQALAPTEDQISYRLHHRETGRELPWSRPLADDPFETFEAPVQAQPGRYLWVTLELRGNTRSSPRIKCLRVEHPGHDLLRRLPRSYSREPTMASFVNRYLALFDGMLAELDGKAADRDILVDPCAAPEEVLPWLASFMGLVLDLRWPPAARRALIREVFWLFRFRGTVPGLKRFLELYLGYQVVIIERFRLIGMGGATLSNLDAPGTSRAIVGAGFRVGGAVGELQDAALSGTMESAFQLEAHRFVVVIPELLTAEQLSVVQHVLDVHRPAHTAFDICTVGAGMSVGRGLHVGLSSVIGKTGAFSSLQLGASRLGRGLIVGRPDPGTNVGNSRLGGDSMVG